ncbi:hypothetical protein [Methylobacter psychrophilus]|uniref:hypothetical protein n=1 Tax=Methylobacter psychrophilus TaxID=96941 RepID=UPI0021D4EC80|nr:hypothetical protein [Methylobacter psychrophilus]
MTKKHLAGLAIGVMMFGMTSVAVASLITSLPGGTIVSMPAVNYVGLGPVTFSDIKWSSTNASFFGRDSGFGFGSNGLWDGALGPMADVYGLSTLDTMKFEFNSLLKGVGGFLNYLPGYGSTPVIAVFDSTNTLIESSELNFSTGGGINTGQFYGFLENSNSIKYFTLTSAYIGITNLTTTNAVPVPAAIWLFGSAILGMIGFVRPKSGNRSR